MPCKYTSTQEEPFSAKSNEQLVKCLAVIYMSLSTRCFVSKWLSLTWDNAAGEARNTLQFCDIVFTEILVTGSIEMSRVAEQRPQLCGHRNIVDDISL